MKHVLGVIVTALFAYRLLVVARQHMSPMSGGVVHVSREDIQSYKRLSELLWRQK